MGAAHNSMLVGCSKYFLTLLIHCAATAPSTTRWSADTTNSITYATLYYNILSYLYGLSGFVECASNSIFLSVLPTPTIVDWGGFITDITLSTPNIPTLLTVVVPPMYSRGSSLPARARTAMSFVRFAMSKSPRVSALYTIGVIRPPYVATATLISACLNLRTTFPCH